MAELEDDPLLKVFKFLRLSELIIRVTDRRRLGPPLVSPLVWSNDDDRLAATSFVIKLLVSFFNVSLIENPLATPMVAGDLILGVT